MNNGKQGNVLQEITWFKRQKIWLKVKKTFVMSLIATNFDLLWQIFVFEASLFCKCIFVVTRILLYLLFFFWTEYFYTLLMHCMEIKPWLVANKVCHPLCKRIKPRRQKSYTSMSCLDVQLSFVSSVECKTCCDDCYYIYWLCVDM